MIDTLWSIGLTRHVLTEFHIFHNSLKQLLSHLMQIWQLSSFLDTLLVLPFWSQSLLNPKIWLLVKYDNMGLCLCMLWKVGGNRTLSLPISALGIGGLGLGLEQWLLPSRMRSQSKKIRKVVFNQIFYWLWLIKKI